MCWSESCPHPCCQRSECEKLQLADEQAKSSNMFDGLDAGPALRAALASDKVQESGIIIINAQGIIQTANQVRVVGRSSLVITVQHLSTASAP